VTTSGRAPTARGNGPGSVARALLLAGVVVAAIASAGQAGTAATRSQATTTSGSGLILSGSAAGLYPGANVTLGITVQNAMPLHVIVNTATVTVFDANGGCVAANLSAKGSVGSIGVAPNASATIPVMLHLADSAPDACQAAAFPLQFSVTGLVDPPGGDPLTNSGGLLAMTGVGQGTALLLLFGLGALTIGVMVLVGIRRPRRREPARR
jgi:hypothetical protein